MKKILVAGLAAALVASALAVPASAQKKKKPKPPVPVATTFFMHGNYPAGEMDGAEWFANTAQGAAAEPMAMDATEPSGDQTKSQNVFSPGLNDNCSGLPLAYPTWIGKMQGTITGDVKLTAHFMSVPGDVTVRIWADVAPFTCNDAYPAPIAETTLTMPSGQGAVEVTFPGINAAVVSHIILQINAPDAGSGYGGQLGRVLYDSTTNPTKLELSCLPAAGASSCVPS